MTRHNPTPRPPRSVRIPADPAPPADWAYLEINEADEAELELIYQTLRGDERCPSVRREVGKRLG